PQIPHIVHPRGEGRFNPPSADGTCYTVIHPSPPVARGRSLRAPFTPVETSGVEDTAESTPDRWLLSREKAVPSDTRRAVSTAAGRRFHRALEADRHGAIISRQEP